MNGHVLTDEDLDQWMRATKTLPHHDPTQFLSWFEGPLRDFFPFDKALLVHGELMAGQINMTHRINSGHEERYLQQMAKSFELSQRGGLRWWLMNQQPFGIDPDQPPEFATDFELQEIRRFGLGRVAAHGVLNLRANEGTYFSFAGIPVPLSAWHADALRLITPVLNSLFLAHIRPSAGPPRLGFEQLTSRQREIVRQLAFGLPDKTIATKLGIAEKTVRNQLATIYATYGLRNRSQLIALLR